MSEYVSCHYLNQAEMCEHLSYYKGSDLLYSKKKISILNNRCDKKEEKMGEKRWEKINKAWNV